MMTQPQDDRIPLRFAALADRAVGAGEALLLEGDAAAPDGVCVARFLPEVAVHPASCVCCTGRHPAAMALGALFQARARGEVAWFTGVVAVVADPAAVATALRADLLAGARFRVPAWVGASGRFSAT